MLTYLRDSTLDPPGRGGTPAELAEVIRPLERRPNVRLIRVAPRSGEPSLNQDLQSWKDLAIP
jgi:hypothetical protein